MAVEGEILELGRPSAFRLELPRHFTKGLGLIAALGLGWAVWNSAPAASLDGRGVHFLATLTVAVVLWVFAVWDEYVVSLLLLLSWVTLGIVPSEVALSGFSKSSWFFVIGALGMAAGISHSGLLQRASLEILRRIPKGSYKPLTFVVSGLGFLMTPALPTNKARASLIAPVSRAISDAIGFTPRSNGYAGLGLCSYIGTSQFSFVFLTGASHCLFGWSLLPDSAKSSFGWFTWTLAALPAGVLTYICLLMAVNFLFPLDIHDRSKISSRNDSDKRASLGEPTEAEWFSLAVLISAIAMWVTTSFHGINEAWVALAALLLFLMTGILDKTRIKNIDWGFVLFFGVMNSFAEISVRLKLDQWVMGIINPVLPSFSGNPMLFLTAIILLVYLVRVFLRREATLALLMLSLTPWAQNMGIHPGVLLMTILVACEGWFLIYQDNSYLLTYYSVEEKAFSHAQARKLMVVKLISCFLVIAVSVPYWKLLGFIR
jgi:DASS family divalent anion:Na+ symporter